MQTIEKAQLFMNGRSQAVRLPKIFRFDGTQVSITKIGESVVLTPLAQNRWDMMEDALAAFEFEPGFVMQRPEEMPQAPRENPFA